MVNKPKVSVICTTYNHEDYLSQTLDSILNQKTNASFYHSPYLPKKHNHVFLEFDNIKIIYNDPRRFGYFKLFENKNNLKNFINNYGPEPFSSKFNLNYLKKYFYKKKKNIKNFLLDQKFV